MPAQDDPFEKRFATLIPVLLDHGWLLSPQMLGGEMDALERVCAELASTNSRRSRREAERDLAAYLVFTAFHPNYRAYYVWLAMQQPHVSALSHLLERAVHHYFGRDYLSAVHLMLSFLEGSLRAHFRQNYPNYASHLTYTRLHEFVREERPLRSYPERHALYRNALADFLERWLFVKTGDADFELSFLNRHYAAHGLGPECYYRPEDCHRLFLFSDLYMEMLVLESGIGEYVFIPIEEPAIHRRREHYSRLMEAAEAGASSMPGFALLKEHPNFVASDSQESLADMVTRWANVMHLDAPRRIQQPRGQRRAEQPPGALWLLRTVGIALARRVAGLIRRAS